MWKTYRGDLFMKCSRIAWRIVRTNLGIGFAMLLMLSVQFMRGDHWVPMTITAFFVVSNVLLGLLDRQDRTIRTLLSGRCCKTPAKQGPNWWAP